MMTKFAYLYLRHLVTGHTHKLSYFLGTVFTNHTLNSQKATDILPSRASYEMHIVMLLEKVVRHLSLAVCKSIISSGFMTELHCLCVCFSGPLGLRPASDRRRYK